MIDYGLIDAAIGNYASHGFDYVEVPWLVSEAVSDMTRPIEAAQYVVTKDSKRKAFVASGEQGFLYLVTKGHLAPGSYQTVTPCIRNDPFDETHVKYFVKNELFVLDPVYAPTMVEDLVDTAFVLFEIFLVDKVGRSGWKLSKVNTEVGTDIELNGIEVGSYGTRKNSLCQWVYGTGLAEPRFSRLINSIARSRS